ncbi:MAG: hypothetical protein RI907_1336, partial [Pseudomonadota bacterium]
MKMEDLSAYAPNEPMTVSAD